jgi:hypothetical protein
MVYKYATNAANFLASLIALSFNSAESMMAFMDATRERGVECCSLQPELWACRCRLVELTVERLNPSINNPLNTHAQTSVLVFCIA